ncbi:MAG: GatB/YqeY domain-containing protein, partial [Candidatus Absconditabacteria bacterium]
KAKDIDKKEILNYVIAQMKNKKIDEKRELTDDECIQIIKKEIKTRHESISYLEKVNDVESIEQDTKKIKILESYLPDSMSYDQLQQLVLDKINELGVQDLSKERGKLIGVIMAQYRSVIDGGMLNEIISSLNK